MNRPQIDTLFLAYRTSGDATALAQVFDLAAPELYELARRLSPDRSAAEDILQDTFVGAIEKRASWDEHEPLLPWLIGILAIASQRRRRERARRPDPGRLPQTQVERPEEALAAHELQVDLEATLAALDPEERSLVEQRLLEGRTPREMARERGLTATTLRMRLSRALARLRRAAPSSLSWALLPWGSRRALHHVRMRVLPGATATLVPLALATAVLGVAAVAGTIGVLARSSPEKPVSLAASQPVAVPILTAPLEPTADAKGAQATEGATAASERSAVAGPAPLFTVDPPPPEGEIAPTRAPPDAPRKRLHLLVLREGKPVEGAEILRVFPDAGFGGVGLTDALGRCDLDVVLQGDVAFCVRGRASKCAYFDIQFDQLRDSEQRTVDLVPGPEPVYVTFHSAWTFPQGFTAHFVPLDRLAGHRPDPEELFRTYLRAALDPETSFSSILPDGFLSNPIVPGRYWVAARPPSGVNFEPPDLLPCCFELTIPEGRDFECEYPGSVGGAIVLDVLGQATIGMDVSVALDGDSRQLMFLISHDAFGHCLSNSISVGTLHVRSAPIPAGEHELVFTQRGKEIDRRRVKIVRGEELKLSISP